jgi:hypothetical protein
MPGVPGAWFLVRSIEARIQHTQASFGECVCVWPIDCLDVGWMPSVCLVRPPTTMFCLTHHHFALTHTSIHRDRDRSERGRRAGRKGRRWQAIEPETPGVSLIIILPYPSIHHPRHHTEPAKAAAGAAARMQQLKQKPPQQQQQQQQQRQRQQGGKRPWVKKKRGSDLTPMDRLQHSVSVSVRVCRCVAGSVQCRGGKGQEGDSGLVVGSVMPTNQSINQSTNIALSLQESCPHPTQHPQLTTHTHAQATKEIGRELKKVKAFLLQRLVKRCRRLRGGGSNKGTQGGNSKGPEEGRWVSVRAWAGEIQGMGSFD